MGSKSVRTTAEPNLAFPKVLAGCRVLVVEDNFLFASTLVRALEHMGCQVIGPCSGVAEAASSLGAGDPHLGILDITVVGGTSADVAYELRRRRRPFIFITGHSTADMLPEDLRAERRLTKPLDMGRLERELLAAMAS